MPRIVDHDAYRAQLLSAAFEHFAAQGYAGVTMRSLAKELGVSTGTLYHYFDTKEALFALMLGHVADAHVVAALGRIDPDADVAARAQALVAFVSEHELALRRFVLLVLERHRVADASDDAARDALRFFRAAIREHTALSDEATASAWLSWIIGWLMQRHLDPATSTLSEQLATASALQG